MLKIKNVEGEVELKRNKVFGYLMIIIGFLTIPATLMQLNAYSSNAEMILDRVNIYYSLTSSLVLGALLLFKKDVRKPLLAVLVLGTLMSLAYCVLSKQYLLLLPELFFALFYFYYWMVPLTEETHSFASKKLLPVFVILLLAVSFYLPQAENKKVMQDLFRDTNTAKTKEGANTVAVLKPVVEYIKSTKKDYLDSANEVLLLPLMTRESLVDIDTIKKVNETIGRLIKAETAYLSSLDATIAQAIKLAEETIPDEKMREVVIDSLSDSKTISLTKEVGKAEVAYFASIKEVYELLESEFGKFGFSEEDGSLIFDSEKTTEKFNSLVEELTTIENSFLEINQSFADYMNTRMAGSGLMYKDIVEMMLSQ